MTPSLNRSFQEYPIPVIRLAKKASPEIPNTDPFAEEKNEAIYRNLHDDLRRLSSIDSPNLRRFSRDFIDIDEAKELPQPTLDLTSSVSATKETKIEKLTNRLKLAIGIPVNEEQANMKPTITELFIKAKNLIKGYEPYGGLEATYGEGSLNILTDLLSQELKNHRLNHADTTLNQNLTLELIEILQETPAKAKESLMNILI